MTLTFEITPYMRRYRRATLRLIEEAVQVHTHLDWQTVEDWLDDPEALILLAWQNNALQGVMASSEVLGGAAWLRLVAIEDFANPGEVIAALWRSLRTQLVIAGVHEMGVLLLRGWLTEYLDPLGFSYCEDIVTLRRYGHEAVPPSLRPEIHIRPAYWNDVAPVVEVDHAAFGPLWRMSKTALRQASRFAAHFTIAEIGGSIVGYQLSTQHTDGGHLARLAVLPALQGRGIGGALVGHMLNHFMRKGLPSVSVNTQETNTQSQNLYIRYGFQRTMQDLPFWKIDL
ncbi:MAG: GNAT family N-acetyltransferase [Anaerolineae bacterium]|nr:GNAT family N-acetyltransferase [Anaerolineae bacterium]